jgi:hypothetical protein
VRLSSSPQPGGREYGATGQGGRSGVSSAPLARTRPAEAVTESMRQLHRVQVASGYMPESGNADWAVVCLLKPSPGTYRGKRACVLPIRTGIKAECGPRLQFPR